MLNISQSYANRKLLDLINPNRFANNLVVNMQNEIIYYYPNPSQGGGLIIKKELSSNDTTEEPYRDKGKKKELCMIQKPCIIYPMNLMHKIQLIIITLMILVEII